MKNKVTIILFFLVILTGCHKDLNLDQPSYVSEAEMWDSEEDFLQAVNGAYSLFRQAFYLKLFNYGDLRSGQYQCMVTSTDDAYVYNNNINSTINCGTNWQPIYNVINCCNLIIKRIDSVEFNKVETKNECLAQAYFLRAFCYFWIARIWGDAPIVLNGTVSADQEDLYPVRSLQKKVFDCVETDILHAEEYMPENANDIKKGTLNAIWMLAADYYLWMGRCQGAGVDALEQASAYLDKVLASDRVLMKNFADIFGIANEENRELIFSIDMTRNEFANSYVAYFYPVSSNVNDKSIINNPVLVASTQYKFKVTDDYIDLMSEREDDSRTALSFGRYVSSSGTYVWPNKFQGEWEYGTRFHSSDLILYRLAEAFMMKAEIAWAQGQSEKACDYLNVIAERAYGVPGVYDPSKYTSEMLQNILVDEYLKEFCMECKSWWTFIRFGVVFDRCPSLSGRSGETNILLWPVYSSCINTNKNITQTVGYN